MLAKVLISGVLEVRVGEAEKILREYGMDKNHPDVLWLEDSLKLGVEQSKKIREHLSFKPYSTKNQAVVLESAQNLTPEAQNSLLKTLEEPPEGAILILCADSENGFLPTMLSRCQLVKVKSQAARGEPRQNRESRVKEEKNFNQDIEKLISSTIEEKFEYIEKLKDREDFLQTLIKFFQKQLESHPGGRTLEFTKELIQAEEWVKSNGNIRATLEYLMLKMPQKRSDK